MAALLPPVFPGGGGEEMKSRGKKKRFLVASCCETLIEIYKAARTLLTAVSDWTL